MKGKLWILSFVLPAVLVSCRDHAAGNRFASPIIGSILSDTTCSAFQLLSSVRSVDRNGTISIVGEPDDAAIIAEHFLTDDMFNNISGSESRDYLPDFAGETASVTLDIANAPYSGYMQYKNTDFLGEQTVRNFLSVVENHTVSSPYDTEEKILRRAPKIVVLASSYSSAFGYHDVDTLCRTSRTAVHVVSVLHSMWNKATEHGFANALVWSTAGKAEAGVYAEVFGAPDANVRYTVLCPSAQGSVESRLHELFDMYKSQGDSSSVTSLIVDDNSVPVDSLKSVLARIAGTEDAGYVLSMRALLDSSFCCITPSEAVLHDCYVWMRSHNAFTHKVAYPDAKLYVTVPHASLAPGNYDVNGYFESSYKFNRAVGREVSTVCEVECKDRYLDVGQLEWLERRTPRLSGEYHK